MHADMLTTLASACRLYSQWYILLLVDAVKLCHPSKGGNEIPAAEIDANLRERILKFARKRFSLEGGGTEADPDDMPVNNENII